MAMTGGTEVLLKTTYPFSDKTKAVKLYLYYIISVLIGQMPLIYYDAGVA